MSLASNRKGPPPSRDLQISKATPPTSIKVTMRGFLEFGTPKTYNTALSYYLQRREVFFKNDVLFKDMDGWNEDGCRFVIPRIVHKDVSERCAKSTVELLQYMAQFALCGQFLVWITEVEEEVPVSDKVSPLPKPKAPPKPKGKNAVALVPKPKPSKTTPYVIEPINEKSIVVAYLSGKEHLLNNRLEEAVTRFSDAINAFPQHAMAYELRGIAQKGLGNTQDALLDFTRSMEICPMHAEAYTGRASILMSQKLYETALKDIQEALLQAVPHQSVYWDAIRLRGECNYKLGNNDVSIKDLEGFLKRPFDDKDPNFANLGRAWKTYGNSLSGLNRFTEAMEAYDMAMQKCSSTTLQANILFSRSMSLKRAGRSDYKTDLEKAAQLGSKKAAEMMQ